MALFADDGTYWCRRCPTRRARSTRRRCFYDDRDLMKTRIERLEHPRIHVQSGRRRAPRI